MAGLGDILSNRFKKIKEKQTERVYEAPKKKPKEDEEEGSASMIMDFLRENLGRKAPKKKRKEEEDENE